MVSKNVTHTHVQQITAINFSSNLLPICVLVQEEEKHTFLLLHFQLGDAVLAHPRPFHPVSGAPFSGTFQHRKWPFNPGFTEEAHVPEHINKSPVYSSFEWFHARRAAKPWLALACSGEPSRARSGPRAEPADEMCWLAPPRAVVTHCRGRKGLCWTATSGEDCATLGRAQRLQADGGSEGKGSTGSNPPDEWRRGQESCVHVCRDEETLTVSSGDKRHVHKLVPLSPRS